LLKDLKILINFISSNAGHDGEAGPESLPSVNSDGIPIHEEEQRTESALDQQG